MRFWTSAVATACIAVGFATAASAQTVKLGVVDTYSGPFAAVGEQLDRGIRLYVKLHEKDLPPGVKLEIIRRDDTGPNPEVAKRMAQELITRDHVQLLAGAIYTPNALAIAPLATEAKVPFIVMNAGTAMITTKSPYIARVSFTMWQSSYPLGSWAAKSGIKKAYTAVSDYGPGIDAEAAFAKGFTDAGGQIVGSVHMPLVNPDYVPFMQRAKDAGPDAVFAFVPAGKDATALMKTFGDLGLKQAGIKLIGPGDITTDEELQNMGDVVLGVVTAFHYSAASTRPANQAFVKAYQDGVQHERRARLRGGRRLRRHGGDLSRHHRAERQDRSGQDDGAAEGLEGRCESARSDHDRSRDARHRAERIHAPDRKGGRQAGERRVRDHADGEGPVEADQ